jgi:prepilin-type N-terminal cleavage/methylation domain-containing protein
MRIAKGFTLLESLISIAVLSFAIIVIFYAYTASMRLFTGELSEFDASFQAHKAMELMTKELRSALEIESASGTSISFWSADLNKNGTRDENETATYSWTGTIEGFINRTVQSSTQEIATGVESLNLTYDDPQPSNIRFINIIITVRKDSTPVTLESGVKCRNL